MSERFIDCLSFVLSREGGYVNHPADRGCATNFGITQRTCDEFFPGLDVYSMTREQAGTIYRRRYWVPGLPPPVDLVVFDCAVNHGPTQAAKFLQSALGGLVVDGVIGAKTLAAANKTPVGAKCIASNILYGRASFYQSLVARDQTQRVFLGGWLNRIAELRKMI